MKNVAHFRVPDSNSAVWRSRVNLPVPHSRIAFETGLKDHIFLQILWILAALIPPGRPQKRIFFSLLEPFRLTRFCDGNVIFLLQNPTPELHLTEQKFRFLGSSVHRRQQIPC